MFIRGFDWIVFGDDTEEGQELISSMDMDSDSRFMAVHFSEGNTAMVLRSIQQNQSLFAQTDEGLYEILYTCPFKGLTPSTSIKSISLVWEELFFYPNVNMSIKP